MRQTMNDQLFHFACETMENAVLMTSSLVRPNPISLISMRNCANLVSSSDVSTVVGPGLQSVLTAPVTRLRSLHGDIVLACCFSKP